MEIGNLWETITEMDQDIDYIIFNFLTLLRIPFSPQIGRDFSIDLYICNKMIF
jgi:hypothetical protein